MSKYKMFFLFAIFCFLSTNLSAQMTWTQTTTSANWSNRFDHSSVIYDNKMWVIGGRDSAMNYKNDVWYSSNGVDWTQATASALWVARQGHSSVVFDNKIWVIGGVGNTNRRDVWYSTDGINWIQATATAEWSARSDHTSIVFDNKMWVIGGFPRTNDVWFSTNGINWTQATASASWQARSAHTSVVYDNKIWVIGGQGNSGALNDIWYSNDGSNWTQTTSSTQWSIRANHTSEVFNNKMWVLGGDIYNNDNNVWYSDSGINWTQVTSNPIWAGRQKHTSLVYDNKMWILGGSTSQYTGRSDVWFTTGLAIEEKRSKIQEVRIFQIFPNPASSYFVVRGLWTMNNTKIKLYDVTGKLVKEILRSTQNDNAVRVPLDGIKNGIYFVKVTTPLSLRETEGNAAISKIEKLVVAK